MRLRFTILCAVVALATPLLAEDAYLSIGGSTGVFHTDMRIFNPSYTKDITVTAYLLAVGADNTNATTQQIVIPKRTMKVYNDVLQAIFGVGGLGGLRLKSDDDFVATQRIYALAADGSTTGQYIGGLDSGNAKKKGLLIQLRNNGGAGQVGTFRTNIGAVNPNPSAANVTWRLFDKNNNLVGQAKAQVIPPFGVVAPTSIGAFTDNCPTPAGSCIAPGAADLTDAWVSYESDQPLFAYSSIVDNATADGTLIPAYEDTGVQQQSQPPNNNVTATFDVTLQQGKITITPSPDGIDPGSTVKFRIHSVDLEHGFRLQDPGAKVLTTDRTYKPTDGVIEQIVQLKAQGTYAYMCTNTTCSPQHNMMYGTFVVGQSDGYQPPGY
jgi:plastocyanin